MADHPDPHERVRAYFETDSASYPAGEPDQPVLAVDYRRTRRALMDALTPAASDRVLEIGTGNGRWARLVAPAVGAYVGIDISDGMLAHARKVTEAAGAKDATFIRTDFLDWDVEPDPFDKVFSVRVLEYFKDKVAMAQRLGRLVKPGGRVVLITKTPRTPFRATGYLTWAIKNRLPRPKRASAGDGKGPLWWDLIAPPRLGALLEGVGFEDVAWGPVVLRAPVYRGSPGDLPLVPEAVSRRLQGALTMAPLGSDTMAARAWTHLSESYILTARRGGGH